MECSEKIAYVSRRRAISRNSFLLSRMCFYNRIEIISIDKCRDMIRRRTSLRQHVLRIIVWRDFSFDGFNDEYLLRNVINLKFQDWIFNSYNIFL